VKTTKIMKTIPDVVKGILIIIMAKSPYHALTSLSIELNVV
jgi:hypothetical protein